MSAARTDTSASLKAIGAFEDETGRLRSESELLSPSSVLVAWARKWAVVGQRDGDEDAFRRALNVAAEVMHPGARASLCAEIVSMLHLDAPALVLRQAAELCATTATSRGTLLDKASSLGRLAADAADELPDLSTHLARRAATAACRHGESSVMAAILAEHAERLGMQTVASCVALHCAQVFVDTLATNAVLLQRELPLLLADVPAASLKTEAGAESEVAVSDEATEFLAVSRQVVQGFVQDLVEPVLEGRKTLDGHIEDLIWRQPNITDAMLDTWLVDIREASLVLPLPPQHCQRSGSHAARRIPALDNVEFGAFAEAVAVLRRALGEGNASLEKRQQMLGLKQVVAEYRACRQAFAQRQRQAMTGIHEALLATSPSNGSSESAPNPIKRQSAQLVQGSHGSPPPHEALSAKDFQVSMAVSVQCDADRALLAQFMMEPDYYVCGQMLLAALTESSVILQTEGLYGEVGRAVHVAMQTPQAEVAVGPTDPVADGWAVALAAALTLVCEGLACRDGARILLRLPALALHWCGAVLLNDHHLAARIFGGWSVALELRLGGKAAGTTSTFADPLLALTRGLSPISEPQFAAPVTFNGREDLNSLRALLRPTGWQMRGRTIICEVDDGFIAFKLQREAEHVAELRQEGAWMNRLAGAASLIPTPLGVVESCVLPIEIREAVTACGIDLHETPAALAYASDDFALWNYVNDVSQVDAESRREGMRRSVVDLYGWLPQGIVNTALTAKNHNVGVEGVRRYEWLFDVAQLRALRLGMGRLDAFASICTYSNVRATGIADLAELASLNDLPHRDARRFDSMVRHLDPACSFKQFGQDAEIYLQMMRFAGDYLLDLTLLIADAHRRQGALQLDHPDSSARLQALSTEIVDVWSLSLATYGQMQLLDAESWLTSVVDFKRMARQLAYFMVPGNYVADFAPAIVVDKWHDTEARRRVVHTPAKEGRRLAATLGRELYGEAMSIEVDFSTCARQWYPPEHASPSGIVGFSQSGEHLDLGIYNGPWPLLELERALYVAVPMMFHARQQV